MEWQEYVAMRTFERVFSDMGLPEDYGCSSWLELYDEVQNNDIQTLTNKEGERAYLIVQYEGAYLPSLLEEEFHEIKYLVRGIKEYEVDLSTCEE